MNQPQIELPQVSLARYLELLKRRRWQVIPISLLGLLIGGLVAFLIPRYYVAQIVVEHTRAPVEALLKPNEDVFAGVVDNAMHTLPSAVEATMRKLGWPEADETDPHRLQENERAVEDRIKVDDLNPGKGRLFAKIVVTYRDLDGQRAADFLNQLLTIWVDQRIGEMVDRAKKTLDWANNETTYAQTEFNKISRDLLNLEKQYGFARDLSPEAQRELVRLREQRLKDWTEQEITASAQVGKLELEIQSLEELIDRTDRTLPVTEAQVVEALPEPLRLPFLQLQAYRSSLEWMGEAHPMRHSTEQQVATLEQKLRELLGEHDGQVTNPKIEKLQDDLALKKQELVDAQSRLERLRAERVAEDERQRQQQAAGPAWTEKLASLENARLQVTQRRMAVDAANSVISELTVAQPVKAVRPATVPPRPTEPNIFLVAVLGCLIGLGVAIGLILLLDVLQTTLKTVDDVERALPVPVLGGISHLETEEEHTRTVTGRRRASLLAGAFLFATVVLVTIYYVDPARLPPFARDFLSLVLGG